MRPPTRVRFVSDHGDDLWPTLTKDLPRRTCFLASDPPRPTEATAGQNCHAGARGFESRRSRPLYKRFSPLFDECSDVLRALDLSRSRIRQRLWRESRRQDHPVTTEEGDGHGI